MSFEHEWRRPSWVVAGIGASLAGLFAGPACAPAQASAPERVALASRSLSDASLFKVTASMDAATRQLALRHDPAARRPDLWGRPEGWGILDLDRAPTLGLPEAEGESAEELNALRPFAKLPIQPMRPFLLKAGAEDSARALQCLSQAIYYEAAREPQAGQEAVAQVVLNRVRHPSYPKSVCGVVYQGSARTTGCQFTFTCDGSLAFAPQPALWRNARRVAERALAGYVAKAVGSATQYHAQYVAPYWAPTLVKMTQVGQHIFYRWTGPYGEPGAFTGRYAGNEAYLTPAILGGVDRRTQGDVMTADMLPAERRITLAVAGEVRTYNVVDPTVGKGAGARTGSTLYSTRRQPTPDEIKRINDSLEAMERSMGARPAG